MGDFKWLDDTISEYHKPKVLSRMKRCFTTMGVLVLQILAYVVAEWVYDVGKGENQTHKLLTDKNYVKVNSHERGCDCQKNLLEEKHSSMEVKYRKRV